MLAPAVYLYVYSKQAYHMQLACRTSGADPGRVSPGSEVTYLLLNSSHCSSQLRLRLAISAENREADGVEGVGLPSCSLRYQLNVLNSILRDAEK